MAFKDEHPEFAKQIEAATVPREKIVAAIRTLAWMIEAETSIAAIEVIENILKADQGA